MSNMKLLAAGFLLAFSLGLAGCATDIMRGYMGRTPQAMMARYGPPAHVFDMPDGRRAYQWLETSESTSAGSEESHTRWVERHGRREKITTTQINPPVNQTKRCFYTMYAHRDLDGGYIFDSFEKPEFGC
ncbi:MAG: hypothetical protein JSR78_12130 [Proteobacteria bacterium]|nr:hypothetical protein [Pseudomonadota bacterium]